MGKEQKPSSTPTPLTPPSPSFSLSPQQIQNFYRDGYLIIPKFWDPRECQELLSQAALLVDQFDPSTSSSIFSTTEDNTEERDAYFLESGDKIRFFWEKEVWNSDGSLRCPKEKAINKIGHALHDLDPVFSRLSYSPKIHSLLQSLELLNPIILQSMYIFKQPLVGGEVVWHQDQTYLETNPEAVIGFWVALEDANLDNGCLWAIPGGHLAGLKKRFIRQGYKTLTEVIDNSSWEDEKKIPLEVSQGSVVLLHGLLPHKSEENRSNKSRHAYTLHFMDQSWKYAETNWLQRGSDLPLRSWMRGSRN